MAKHIPYNECHREINGFLEKKCSKHYVYLPNEDPWIPATEEYYNKKFNNKKDGLAVICKRCLSIKYKLGREIKPRAPKIPRRLIRILSSMKQRCYNLNNPEYHYYGGRGIIICDEWLKTTKNFYDWALNNGYTEDLTIDRINVNGNYEPDNCRWATWEQQGNNKRDTIIIEIDGDKKSLSQWSRETGIKRNVLHRRIKNNNKDIYEDDVHHVRIEVNGEIKSLQELAKDSGMSYELIRKRHDAGYNLEDMLNPSIRNKEVYHIEIKGITHTVTEWAEISGLTRNIILTRIFNGWRGERLLIPKMFEKPYKYIKIGNESHTKDEWCEIMDISTTTFYKRIRKGIIIVSK